MSVKGPKLEQAVLGHALTSKEHFQKLITRVPWNDFSVPNHKVMAYCLHRMAQIGITKPDEDSFALVVDGYPGEGDKDYGGTEYVRTLIQGYSNPTENYDVLLDSMALWAVKVKVGKHHVENIARVVNNPNSTNDDLRDAVDNLRETVEDLQVGEQQFSDAKQITEAYYEELDRRVQQPFFTTGFTCVDDKLSEGFIPGKITVMAGFTGMAKSTITANMAQRIAAAGFGVGIFSLEAQKESVWDKLVSTFTQIQLVKLKKQTNELTSDERQRIDDALERLRGIPLLINDRASMSMSEMRYQIMAAKRRGYDLKVIFIDLFGKLEDVDTGDNLAARIQQKCKQMRVMAQELEVHFVLVVQIGRQGFGRSKSGKIKRPVLTDIKNANAYGEESDLTLLLHRNKYYDQNLVDDILEVIIAKQRDGEAGGTVYLEMFADTSTLMCTTKKPVDYEDD